MYVCIYVRLYVRICNHHNRWEGGRIIKEERKKCNYLFLKKKNLQFVTYYVYTRNNTVTINALRYTLHSLNLANR